MSDDLTIHEEAPVPVPPQKPLARLILITFVLTFVASRAMVILIMVRIVPDFFLHIGQGQTHVHHLNYGIFLLSGVGAYLLLRRPTGGSLTRAAIVYGVGLALTFDEFGMWLHLGGSYWQRASFDAVVTITAVLGLIAVAPAIRRFRPEHWIVTVIVGLAVTVFGVMLVGSVYHLGDKLAPFFRRIEQSGPQ